MYRYQTKEEKRGRLIFMTNEEKKFVIGKVVNTLLSLATALASYFLGASVVGS